MLAVDVGGSKLAAGLVTGSGRLVEQLRTATAPAVHTPGDRPPWSTSGGTDPTFELLWSIVEPFIDRAEAVGVGCGGPMVGGPRDRRMSPLHIRGWEDFPLAKLLAERSGLDVVVDNDAKALALGEGWCGAAVGHRDFLAMVVSTGVGGGIVLDGRLLGGATDNAGHIGHLVVDPEGPACACGSRGCLEAVASGTAIAVSTGALAADASEEVRRRVGTMVGRGVGDVVNLLDLPLAVVAGSVALGFGAPFFDAAAEALQTRCGLAFTAGARIVPAGLGVDGPLVGAAAVWHHYAGSGVLPAGPALGEDRG
ncbi:MAG: ROK family protein [Acidimicrobiales bacterium]|nr:ROK family protein [Acidimicrobiales bacterium]